MNEVIKNAIAWETDKAEFTDALRQRMRRVAGQKGNVPRLMLCNRRRVLVLAATIACVLTLVGFTAASIFGKLFATIPYHDVVVSYKATEEYAALVDSLAPGDVAATLIDEKGASVLYKYFKGDSFDLECYGENVPSGGFIVIPIYDGAAPDGIQTVSNTDRTPDYYRQQGQFSFALEDPAYTLVEVTQTRSGLFSLTYEMLDGRRIAVEAVYGRYQDTRGELDYRPEYTTINGWEYMILETEDQQGIECELFCYLGDGKLVPGIALSGLTREELVEAAEHLVFYNEDTNVPGAVAKTPADIYSDNADPLLQKRAGEVMEAVTRAMESGSEFAAWSADGREIYADSSEHASYDILITYTSQAWSAVEASYEIPAPPLTPYGWTEGRPVKSVSVAYLGAQLEFITICYEDGSGFDELSIYPLDLFQPQTQLDATLMVFIPAGGQIPDELVRIGGNYSMKGRTEYGDALIYTAILADNNAWGYRYWTQS